MAHVLAGILPEEALPPVYDALITESYATHRFITDVTEYTPYYQDILSCTARALPWAATPGAPSCRRSPSPGARRRPC